MAVRRRYRRLVPKAGDDDTVDLIREDPGRTVGEAFSHKYVRLVSRAHGIRADREASCFSKPSWFT